MLLDSWLFHFQILGYFWNNRCNDSFFFAAGCILVSMGFSSLVGCLGIIPMVLCWPHGRLLSRIAIFHKWSLGTSVIKLLYSFCRRAKLPITNWFWKTAYYCVQNIQLFLGSATRCVCGWVDCLFAAFTGADLTSQKGNVYWWYFIVLSIIFGYFSIELLVLSIPGTGLLLE